MENFKKIIELLSIEKLTDKILSNEEKNKIIEKIDSIKNVYPFNIYEYFVSNLLGKNKINLEQYEEIREEYIEKNYYLNTFEMAGKKVGMWAEQLLISGGYGLKKPSKKIDKNYSQETSYDAYLEYSGDIIRIEIKASRVTESGNDDIFIEKALFSNTNKKFWMNFQQLKPQYSDVFIFIAIYRDKIKYWIIPSNDVKNYGNEDFHIGNFSKGQHSGNKGNEGQLHIKDNNISDFDKYLSNEENIKKSIIEAYKKQIQK